MIFKKGVIKVNTSFRDCYIEFTDNRLKIGNQKVERIIEIKNGLPVSISFGNECNKWQGGNVSMFNVADFDFKNADISFDSYISGFGGKSEEALTGELIFKTEDIYIKLLIYVFPGIGAISTKLYIKGNIISSQKTCKLSDTSIESNNTDALIDAVLPENGVIDSFNISDKHIKARAVRLYDQTDVYNELVSYEDRLLYRRYDEYLSGSFLILDNYTEKKAIMLVSEGYVSGKKFCLDNDFSATKDAICVFGSGIEDNFDDCKKR